MTPLKQFFKNKGLTTREVAEMTGQDYARTSTLINNPDRMTDGARAKFLRVWPELYQILFWEEK